MTPDQLQTAIDFAKNNPNDPRSKELRRRMEAGQLNAELEQAGLQTFDIPKPKLRQNLTPDQKSEVSNSLASLQGPKSPYQSEGGVKGILATPENRADFVGDVKSATLDAGADLIERRKNIQEIFKSDQDPFSKGFQLVGQIAGGAIDLGERGVQLGVTAAMTPEAEKEVTDIGKAILDTETGQMAMDAIAGGMESWESFKAEHPTTAGNLEAAFNISEVLTAGFGAPVVTRGVQRGVETGMNVAEKTLDVAASGVEKTADIVRGLSEELRTTLPSSQKPSVYKSGVSDRLIANINRITPNQRQEFNTMTKGDRYPDGATPEQWLKERGIVGTREQTLETLSNNFVALRNNVDEALAKIPGTLKDKSVTDVAQASAEYAGRVKDPQAGRIAELAEKAEGVGLTMTEVNEVKRYFERHIKLGYGKDPTMSAATVELNTNLDNSLREYLIKEAGVRGFPELREINREINQTKFLMDNIAGRMVGEGANNAISLSDWIILTPGVTMNPGYVAGFIGKKILSTEAVRGFAAKALSGFPDVQPIPAANMEQIEKQAQEYLQKVAEAELEVQKQRDLLFELEQNGLILGVGDRAGITSLPISKEEIALLNSIKHETERRAILEQILEARQEGSYIGEGFKMKPLDTMPAYAEKPTVPQDAPSVPGEDAPHVDPPSEKREPPIEF